MASAAVALTLLIFSAVAASAQTSNSTSPPGRIVGNIDAIAYDGEQGYISGWACQQGRKDSILIHVYGAPASDPAKRVFLAADRANFASEPAVNRACQDGADGAHRFFAALPFGVPPDERLFVHGIRVVDGVPNDAIAGSGAPLRRADHLRVPFARPSVPPLAGSYRRATGHPRVFTSEATLRDLVARIGRRPSYSATRFAQLAGQVARDLAAPNDWDAVYSGCNIGPYLYAFSYEPQDGHDAETHALMRLDAATKAPAGGAVVASRLALYAVLVKLGAPRAAGSPDPDRAASLAKRILFAWADRGFPRDAQGRFLPASGLACDKYGKPLQNAGWALPLQLGRGVVYSVHAQDLLEVLGIVDAAEAARLDALHAAVFDLIRE